MIGAGGVISAARRLLARGRADLRERDVLFIADEVICGFGRLGHVVRRRALRREPDLITAAKGITSGYIPLGAVIASAQVRAPFWARAPRRSGTATRTRAIATACAVALANLDIIEREGLLDRVRAGEAVLAEALGAVAGKPAVGEVRHAGLLGTIELAPDLVAERPTAADEVALAARSNGVLTRVLRGVAFQFSPAFVSTDDELRAMVATVAAAIDTVGSVTLPPCSTRRGTPGAATSTSRTRSRRRPVDLVLVSGCVSHLDLDWEEPRSRGLPRRLALVRAADPLRQARHRAFGQAGGLPDLETRMDDVRAVMDAAGSERAALFGYSEGGPMCVAVRGDYPERTAGLVLYGTYAKRADPDDDYPWATTMDERRASRPRSSGLGQPTPTSTR